MAFPTTRKTGKAHYQCEIFPEGLTSQIFRKTNNLQNFPRDKHTPFLVSYHTLHNVTVHLNHDSFFNTQTIIFQDSIINLSRANVFRTYLQLKKLLICNSSTWFLFIVSLTRFLMVPNFWSQRYVIKCQCVDDVLEGLGWGGEAP